MIYNDDWDYLVQQYGPTSDKRIGAGNAIRELVHRAVTHLRDREQRLRDERRERLVKELQDAE